MIKTESRKPNLYIDGSANDWGNSIANTLDLPQRMMTPSNGNIFRVTGLSICAWTNG